MDSSKILKFAALIVVVSINIVLLSGSSLAAKSSKLKVGFYGYTCPQAEIIVRKAVEKAVSKNPGFAAGLIRMHFHDCFVRGCDGSVLVDTVEGKEAAEKDSLVNFPSLRGFEVIDEAKAMVEAACPKTVSCADILAFAARDSALKASGHMIWYEVPSGRRDGSVSLSSEVLQNLPPPFFTAAQLRDNFKRKGLSVEDMVVLSGAHSIGVSHCSSFANRLSGFNATFNQDPSLHPGYAAFLKTRCAPGNGDPAVSNDALTPARLDNKYYVGLKDHKGLLTSDQTLFDSSLTKKMVVDNGRYGSVWGKKFGAAMVRMGSIDVLTGNQGHIRTNCRLLNN